MSTGFTNNPPVSQQLVDNLVGGNIGGIFSTRPQAKYMSGARCILRINSKPVAFAFDIGWRISTSYTEIQTIDNTLPEELVPKFIRVEGNISAMHIPGQGPGVQLWQPDTLSFLFHQYITIEVRDSATNQLLFFAPRAVITLREESVRAEDLASIRLNFMSIGFRDEKTPEIPDGVLTTSSDKLTDKHTDASSIISTIGGLIKKS